MASQPASQQPLLASPCTMYTLHSFMNDARARLYLVRLVCPQRIIACMWASACVRSPWYRNDWTSTLGSPENGNGRRSGRQSAGAARSIPPLPDGSGRSRDGPRFLGLMGGVTVRRLSPHPSQWRAPYSGPTAHARSTPQAHGSNRARSCDCQIGGSVANRREH